MTTPAPLVALDVETDGLHPGRRIWEYAAIRRDFHDDGTTTETQHHAYVAIDLRNSDPFGLKVGGFWDRHPSGRKISGQTPTAVPCPPVQSKHDAARDLMRLTFGARIVGVNPAFDTETIAGLLRAEGYVPSWDYRLIDLYPLAAGWLHAIQQMHGYRSPRGGVVNAETIVDTTRSWKSDELSRACGVEPPSDDDRHTALGDARWALTWMDAITRGNS